MMSLYYVNNYRFMKTFFETPTLQIHLYVTITNRLPARFKDWLLKTSKRISAYRRIKRKKVS